MCSLVCCVKSVVVFSEWVGRLWTGFVKEEVVTVEDEVGPAPEGGGDRTSTGPGGEGDRAARADEAEDLDFTIRTAASSTIIPRNTILPQRVQVAPMAENVFRPAVFVSKFQIYNYAQYLIETQERRLSTGNKICSTKLDQVWAG